MVCALVVASAAFPLFVSAGTTVVNTVETSASSGGNSAGEGEVVEGKSSSSVKVKTVINDEVVEDYEAVDEGEGATEATYRQTTTFKEGQVEIVQDASASVSVPTSPHRVTEETATTSVSASSSQAALGEVSLPTLDDGRGAGIRAFISKLFGYIFNIF